jgi:RNA polymerase sigma-70 factor, ECF subfamily
VLLHESKASESQFARARQGDRRAFAEIVRLHQRMVHGLALRMLNRSDLAEELAQDVFLKMYHSLPQLETPDHLRFWLRRVTANLAIDRLRQLATAGPHSSLDDVDPEAPSVATDPLLERTLQQLVARLAPDARAVVVLRYQQDLDPTDIAATLDMPLNTVKSHLKRSLDSLRTQLDPEVVR